MPTPFMELHQIFRILFLRMFLYSLMFVGIYTIVTNIIALIIASLFEAYSCCLDLLSFILPHVSIKQYVSCWVGFQL